MKNKKLILIQTLAKDGNTDLSQNYYTFDNEIPDFIKLYNKNKEGRLNKNYSKVCDCFLKNLDKMVPYFSDDELPKEGYSETIKIAINFGIIKLINELKIHKSKLDETIRKHKELEDHFDNNYNSDN